MMSELEYAKQLRKRKLRPRCARDRLARRCGSNTSRIQGSDSKASVLRDLWFQPLTQEQIARQLGVKCNKTVANWAMVLGLPPRSPVRRAPARVASVSTWPPVDDDFVLLHYRKEPPRWIGCHLPSGRKVSKNAVIGRHRRLTIKKQPGSPATVTPNGSGLEASS